LVEILDSSWWGRWSIDATIVALIKLSVIMTRRLPIERRAAIAFQMSTAAADLGARWN